MKDVRLSLPIGFTCGETPYWVPEEDSVYLVDTENPRIARFDVSTEKVEIITVPYAFQCLHRRIEGGWIGSITKGVALWDDKKNTCTYLGSPGVEKDGHFCNDGTVDKTGRLLFGIFDMDALEEPSGTMYCVDHDFTFKKVADGLFVPNGMAFSDDNKTLYVNEQFGPFVSAYDWDSETLSLSNKRKIYTLAEGEGLPDGLIMDADGHLWIAHWWGWKISQITTDGKLLQTIDLPVTTPTSMVLAGPDMDKMYITTARKAVEEEDLKKGFMAGHVFSLDGMGTGRLENKFGK